MTTFSFLLPTRGRPELVQRFFQSVVETTSNLDDLEIILAVDDDDLESQAITHDRLLIKKVILPRGATMGGLNRACFEASSGRYVMLSNDDVVIRTSGWDKAVAAAFARYEDDIALIQVNDLLFRERLCTFPIMSRRACLEIGVCPAEYRRYRIDDHIYDTYHLLAYLGHKRITYLEDVVFEHHNTEEHTPEHDQSTGHLFKSVDNKVYVPDPEIIGPDAQFFDDTFPVRQKNAAHLAHLIDQTAIERQQHLDLETLSGLSDSLSYRRGDFLEKVPPSVINSKSISATVTVAVVTSDIYQKHAQKCLSLLKKHTTNFDLLILDNNKGQNFNHPREMNKILRSVKTDFLVLMDDDVYVEAGWLPGLAKAMREDVSVVGPMYKDAKGNISFAGVYLMGDEHGTHAHLVDKPAQPRECQILCSAILLIDTRKANGVFFDERYRKYFLDLDYSLKVWESGYKIVCTPDVIVTHVGGATMPHGSRESFLLWIQDMRTFVASWVDSGRLLKIQEDIWSHFEFLNLLSTIPKRIKDTTKEVFVWDTQKWQKELKDLIRLSQPFELFSSLLVLQVRESLALCEARGDSERVGVCKAVLAQLKHVKVRHSLQMAQFDYHRGYNLVEWNRTYAVPSAWDISVITNEEQSQKYGVLAAENPELVKALVDQAIVSSTDSGSGHNRRWTVFYWRLRSLHRRACQYTFLGLCHKILKRILGAGYRRLRKILKKA